MSFKKYSEMELALLASIATMDKEDMENICIEKGDYAPVIVEDHISIPSYIRKPDASHHAQRRKATFKKKVEQKRLARQVGYDLSTENSKKVESMLSANHTDRRYFHGDKVERKNWTVREEVSLMEQEQMEQELEEQDDVLNNILCDFHIRCQESRYADNAIAHARKMVEEATKELNKALALKQAAEHEISELENQYFAYCALFGRKDW